MDARPEKVLLATDGSGYAALATRAAADISKEGGAELHVAHVWTMVPSAHFGTYVWRNSEQVARDLLDEEVEKLEKTGTTVAGSHLREGPIVDGILDLADEVSAGLIVMGSRGHGRVNRMLLGSVSDGVVHNARCPVLVTKGDNSWPPRRVVIGDDASDNARQAGELAANLGKLWDARILLLRAYPELPPADEEGRGYDARRVDDELHREEASLEGRARTLREATGLKVRIRLAEADPAEAALQAARENDESNTLLAVGSRGLGAVARVRLGSTSTKLLHAARGPVLVVPQP